MGGAHSQGPRQGRELSGRLQAHGPDDARPERGLRPEGPRLPDDGEVARSRGVCEKGPGRLYDDDRSGIPRPRQGLQHAQQFVDVHDEVRRRGSQHHAERRRLELGFADDDRNHHLQRLCARSRHGEAYRRAPAGDHSADRLAPQVLHRPRAGRARSRSADGRGAEPRSSPTTFPTSRPTRRRSPPPHRLRPRAPSAACRSNSAWAEATRATATRSSSDSSWRFP